MSKIIEFDPRDYRFDDTCMDNVGERAFITTDLGIKEVWEIGDWGWNWTQIFREMTLEKNTDYTLRFAVSGGYCDTWDSVSKVWIYHTDGYDTPEAAWEDKMNFPLDNDRFAPIISKKDRTGVIRVFELPFNTGNFENWRITFVAQHAVARFMSAGEYSSYEKLPDLTLGELKNSGDHASDGAKMKNGSRINLSGASISRNTLNDILFNLPENADINLSGADVFDDVGPAEKASPSGHTECPETQFADMLSAIRDGNINDFKNITITPDVSPEEKLVIGEPADGVILGFSNVKMTSLAMSAIMAKLCDGCIVNFTDVNVTAEGLDRMMDFEDKSDGAVINLSNVTLPEKVLKHMREKLGDGCCFDTENVTAYPV